MVGQNSMSMADMMSALGTSGPPDPLTALTNIQQQQSPVKTAGNTLVPHPWTNAGQLKLWDVMSPDGGIAGSLMKNSAPFSKWKVLIPGSTDPIEFDTKKAALRHLGIAD